MDPNAYFKHIAETHKSISHTEQSPAYFREYSSSSILLGNSDFLHKMKYAKEYALISQFNKDGNYEGLNDDTFHKVNTGTLYIIKKVKSNEINDAYTDTNTIWQQILAKMIYDEEQGVFDSEGAYGPAGLRFRDCYVHSIGMIADGYYGIAVFISFHDFEDGSCITYDSTKWN